MADYFDEMGWQPLQEGETPNHLMDMVRFLLDYQVLNPGNLPLAPPASKESVASLPSLVITQKEGECTICLKPWELHDTVKEMPCKHRFHPHCILPWLDKTNSCPLCRHELPTDDQAYEETKQRRKRALEREKDIETLHNSMFG